MVAVEVWPQDLGDLRGSEALARGAVAVEEGARGGGGPLAASKLCQVCLSSYGDKWIQFSPSGSLSV